MPRVRPQKWQKDKKTKRQKKKKKSMYTCMCNWVTMLYSRKLTEHCKPATMEKKNCYIIKKCMMKRQDLECYFVISCFLSLFAKESLFGCKKAQRAVSSKQNLKSKCSQIYQTSHDNISQLLIGIILTIFAWTIRTDPTISKTCIYHLARDAKCFCLSKSLG